MKVLVITHKDGPNLFIENVVKELVARGHEIAIYAQFQDDTSIRMFQSLMVPIHPLKELTNKIVQPFDFIFCPIQSLGLGQNLVFYNKYIFSCCNMNPAFDHVRGADFLFTLGRLREPYEQTFSYMPIGITKNDTVTHAVQADSRRILVVDSGHFPFAEEGKRQAASMIVEMCRKLPEYEICVKPRWLPDTDIRAMTHINLKHLYEYIDESCQFQRPENLNLLMEHFDLQELIDGSRSVVTLCTTAYLDVALRGKGLIVAKGFDNEDMYQVRKSYFDRLYTYAEGSGCVVDYHDVCNYLPDGLPCHPEHLKETFTYTTGVSARIVEVMEYVSEKYLEYDLYPAIESYDYENYQQEMRADPELTLNTLKRWRMYCVTDSVIALNRSISPTIDWADLVQRKKAVCLHAQPTKQGLSSLRKTVEKMKYSYIIEHGNQLQSNEIDKSFFFGALFHQKKYDELIAILESNEQDHCVLQYYCGRIFYERGEWSQAANCLSHYWKEIKSRTYLKYYVEKRMYKRPGILCLLDSYYQQGDLNTMAPLLVDYLNDPEFIIANLREQKQLRRMISIAKKYYAHQQERDILVQLREKDKQRREWVKSKIRTTIKQRIKKKGVWRGFKSICRTAIEQVCGFHR